jgi:hypothetical protein
MRADVVNKQRFVFRYEDLYDDPEGAFYDFLVATGVGRQVSHLI